MTTDIEIARATPLRPIVQIAAHAAIPEVALEPFGRFVAKLHRDFVADTCARDPGKLVLVSAISPTPAGEGKTTTTIGLGDALNRIGRRAMTAFASRLSGRASGRRAAQREADGRRSCRWSGSTCTSRATSTPSAPLTTCSPRSSTIISTGTTISASIPAE